MTRIFLVFALFMSLMVNTARAQDGPFGLQMGMTVEQVQKLTKLKSDKPYIYSAASLPDGHSQIETYSFLITPQHGLCKVTAATVDFTTSVYGSELKRKFDDFKEALNAKYGKSKDYDFLSRGSIWNEPREWMMALRKKERILGSFWAPENGSSLPSSLGSIMLEAEATSTEKGYVRIAYEYSNFDPCVRFIKSQGNSKL